MSSECEGLLQLTIFSEFISLCKAHEYGSSKCIQTLRWSYRFKKGCDLEWWCGFKRECDKVLNKP